MADARSRRVLMASPGGRRGKGGMASLVVYLAEALPKRIPGIEIGIVDTYGPGQFWAMPFHFLAALARVAFLAALGRADLLHVHMAHYGSALRKLILALVATALGLKTVMHVHGSDFDLYYRGLPGWGRRLVVSVLKRCARVIVIGEHWRQFAVDALGLDPAEVALIHNGAPAVPWRAKPGGHEPRILMLGELGPRKGTPELIAALASPALKSRAWHATLAGNGPVEKYRAEAAVAGLAERVDLPGWQDAARVRALLEEADIFVLPSRHEGLPVAILEAMAGGAAVIATPVGAIADAIVDGETGLLVPPGDAAKLAEAIARLIDDPAVRARLALAARARFEAKFTIDRTADRVAALYRDLGVG